MAVELILVRHGQTVANSAGQLSGHHEVELTDLGRVQAAAVGRHLAAAELHIDAIVVSPLGRAQATAAAVCAEIGGRPTIDTRLIELDYGAWDGRPLADVTAHTWAQWRSDVEFRPPDGESLAELGERVRAFISERMVMAGDRLQRVVVVSHVSPIKALVCAALDIGDEHTWNLFVSPASITRLRFSDSAHQVLSFNETAHLRDAGSAGGASSSARPADGASNATA